MKPIVPKPQSLKFSNRLAVTQSDASKRNEEFYKDVLAGKKIIEGLKVEFNSVNSDWGRDVSGNFKIKKTRGNISIKGVCNEETVKVVLK